MGYLIAIALAYLLGSSSMSLYLSLLQGVNLRSGGSGNLGASNAVILMGWKAGVLVALHDIGKASLAVWLAQRFFPTLPYIGSLAMPTVFGWIAEVLGYGVLPVFSLVITAVMTLLYNAQQRIVDQRNAK